LRAPSPNAVGSPSKYSWCAAQDSHTRRAYIGHLENTVSAEDGVTLRKKATLMRDVQRLARE
jgi:hypothetical protein